MQYFIRQTFETEEEVAKQAEHLRHTYSTHTQVEEAKKVHYFQNCDSVVPGQTRSDSLIRIVNIMSRLIPDIGPCHQHQTRLNHSGPVLQDAFAKCHSHILLLILTLSEDCCGKYNSAVEDAYELATFCTLCQHFLQIFSWVNVASFSHIISSLILQTILQTIPITLLGAQTCNALLLLLTFYYYLYPECFIFWTVL